MYDSKALVSLDNICKFLKIGKGFLCNLVDKGLPVKQIGRVPEASVPRLSGKDLWPAGRIEIRAGFPIRALIGACYIFQYAGIVCPGLSGKTDF